MNIRLRQLRAFVSVVDTGSVTDSANLLALTQSSVSKLLASLEKEIGFSLFDRVGKRLRLTEQGRMFLKQAQETIDRVADIHKVAEDIRDHQGKRLRIAAIGPILFSQLLPSAMTLFSQSRPDYRLSVDMKVRIEIEDWIARHNSDIGFTLLPVDVHQLSFCPIASGKVVVAVPTGHRLATKKFLTPKDVAHEHLILPRPGVRVRALVETNFVEGGIDLNVQTEATTMISVVHLVANGMGIGIVDPFTLSGIDQSNIAIIPWKPEIELTYGAIWPKTHQLTQVEEEFIAFVESVVLEVGAAV